MRIRKATAEDCPAMLELIPELDIYEKAPDVSRQNSDDRNQE